MKIRLISFRSFLTVLVAALRNPIDADEACACQADEAALDDRRCRHGTVYGFTLDS